MKRFIVIILISILVFASIGCLAEDSLFYIWNVPFGTPSNEARTQFSSILGKELEIQTNDKGGKLIACDIDISKPTLVAGYQLSSILCHFFKNNGFNSYVNPNIVVEDDGRDGLSYMMLTWKFKKDESTPEDYGLNAFLGITNQFTSQYGGAPQFYASGKFSDTVFYCPATNKEGSLDLDIAHDLIARTSIDSIYSILSINKNIQFSLSQLNNLIYIRMVETYIPWEFNKKYTGDYWEVRYTPTPQPIGF